MSLTDAFRLHVGAPVAPHFAPPRHLARLRVDRRVQPGPVQHEAGGTRVLDLPLVVPRPSHKHNGLYKTWPTSMFEPYLMSFAEQNGG